MPVYPRGVNGGAATSREQAEDWVRRLNEEEAERQAIMAAKRKERKASRDAYTAESAGQFMVGCIVVASWGWEQTNVDAWQIVKRFGKTGIELREIGWDTVPGSEGLDCDYRRPVKDAFIKDAESMRKRISGGCVKIDDCRTAFPDSGRNYYCSWYA